MSAVDRAVLKALLDREAGFDAEYDAGGGRSFTSHRAMTLQALARLGAGDARLEAFAATYEARLRPAPAAQAWPVGEAWAGNLGQREAWPIYRDLFAQWLDAEDAGEVLAQVLPRLFEGVAAAAFHGPIRTAHAVAAAHRGELTDALAYWAARWLPLGTAASDAKPRDDDPEAVLRRLRRAGGGAASITAGLRAAAAAPDFDRRCAELAIGPQTLPQLSRLAAKAYAATGNFTALHLVTGSLALRELLVFVDADDAAAQQAAVAAFWRGFVAAVASAGLKPLPPAPLKPWPALVKAALASDDERVIKLVDACVQLRRLDAGGPWQQAASRAVATLV